VLFSRNGACHPPRTPDSRVVTTRRSRALSLSPNHAPHTPSTSKRVSTPREAPSAKLHRPSALRPFPSFGALASVRAQTSFGQDTGLVEFWREEDARRAEEALHCAEIDGQNIAVQLYNRRGSGVLSEFSPRAPPFVPSGSAYPSPYPTQVSFQSPNRRPLSHSQSVFAPKSEPIPSSLPPTVHSWSGPAGSTRTPSWSRV
jgi:hypothetical protein